MVRPGLSPEGLRPQTINIPVVFICDTLEYTISFGVMVPGLSYVPFKTFGLRTYERKGDVLEGIGDDTGSPPEDPLVL